MPFREAIRVCFAKYATFSGRGTRPEFWWFMLFIFSVLFATALIHETLSQLAGLALLLPSLSAAARRLHDTGKSAWFLLLGFVPLVGSLLLLYFYVRPSDGPNQFGNPEVTPYSPTVLPGPGPH